MIPALPGEEHGPIVVHKGDYVLWSDYAMMRNEKVRKTPGVAFAQVRISVDHTSPDGVGVGDRCEDLQSWPSSQ